MTKLSVLAAMNISHPIPYGFLENSTGATRQAPRPQERTHRVCEINHLYGAQSTRSPCTSKNLSISIVANSLDKDLVLLQEVFLFYTSNNLAPAIRLSCCHPQKIPHQVQRTYFLLQEVDCSCPRTISPLSSTYQVSVESARLQLERWLIRCFLKLGTTNGRSLLSLSLPTKPKGHATRTFSGFRLDGVSWSLSSRAVSNVLPKLNLALQSRENASNTGR